MILPNSLRKYYLPLITVIFLGLIGIFYPILKFLRWKSKRKPIQKPIRVLYVIATLEVGGTETQLINLLKAISKEEFQPFICCLRRGGFLEKKIREMKIPLFILKEKGRFNFTIIFDILKILKKYKIDILHSFLFVSNFWARLAGILASTRVILASERAAWKKSSLIIYDRILSYFTDKIICNSQAVKRYQIETEKINPKKLEVVYNGIDLEDFDKRLKLAREKADQYKKELGIKENEVVIGNVCRFTPEKNLEDWLKTAFLLLKENKNLKFLLVGDANPKIEEEPPYKERILKLMKELNLENNIILTGESLEVTRELAIMDLFFQSSISEGFPNSLMEAMATSLAIVATPAGGTRELVTKETGIILEFENKKNWPKIILELISNKNKMEKIGKKGRERIEKHFTNKILAKNIERIYLSLFGQN